MNFAIIAAGEGSRLAQEGILEPKPLVSLCGKPLLGRLFEVFASFRPESISLIVNEQMVQVQEWVEAWKVAHPDVCLNVCIQSTPSSMHSLSVLSRVIPAGKFILTTVDTIFLEREFSEYVARFERMQETEGDGLFAVTPFVDDEKPLWISTDECGYISEFSDKEGMVVSGGIYGLNTRTAFPILEKCLAEGQSRMRNYQRALVSAGLHLVAHSFPQIMDIDHAEDIRKAESFLRLV